MPSAPGTRRIALLSAGTVYDLEVAGPDANGELVMSGTRRIEGGASKPLPPVQLRVTASPGELVLVTDGRTEQVAVVPQRPGVWVSWRGRAAYVEPFAPRAGGSRAPKGGVSGDEVRAPMTGVLVEVRAAPGDHVRRDQVLAVLEAMKMEYRLVAPRDGEVAEVPLGAGDRTEIGSVVVRLK